MEQTARGVVEAISFMAKRASYEPVEAKSSFLRPIARKVALPVNDRSGRLPVLHPPQPTQPLGTHPSSPAAAIAESLRGNALSV